MLTSLLGEIRHCNICADLPLGPRPVLSASHRARILVAGQAPGTRVHKTGTPFDDPSGDRLREWMGIGRDVFYDSARINIVPMGFCYPGRAARGGDLPPRIECRQTWHDRIFGTLPQQGLTLVIGRYAMDYHLGIARAEKLTNVVREWREYAPRLVPLPHPSPRNNLWLRRNPWFEAEVVPYIRRRVKEELVRCRG